MSFMGGVNLVGDDHVHGAAPGQRVRAIYSKQREIRWLYRKRDGAGGKPWQPFLRYFEPFRHEPADLTAGTQRQVQR